MSAQALTILNLSDAWVYTAEADNLVRVSVEMKARGHRVVVGCSPNTQLADACDRRGLEKRLLPGLRAKGNPISFVQAVRAVRRLVAELDPDVVHAWRSPPHVIAALALGSRARARLVRTRGTMDRPKRSPLNRALYGARTAVTLVTAEAVRAECIAAGLAASRLEVVYGSIELERFSREAYPRATARRELGLDESTPVVVHLARLAPIKGHEFLVEAARRVVDRVPAATFLLVGQEWPGMREKIEAQIRARGLEPNFRVFGKVEDVGRVLGGADVGVVASVGSEAMSRAALEYMAMALPVVATRVGSLPELVDDGRTGRLVPPRDPAALADALLAYLSDAERGRAAGRAGRARVEERFGASAQADRLEEVYAHVLGRAAPAGRIADASRG